jgi:hypothetical protein
MLLFCDSFDTTTSILDRWDALVGNVGISATAKRTGRNGILFNPFLLGDTITKNFTSRATYIIGFAVSFQTIGGGDTVFCGLADTGTMQVTLTINSAGIIKAYRGNGATLLGTAGITVSPFTAYHYLEVKWTIDPSAGVVSVQLDGVNILNLTGQNTRASANSSANQLVMGGAIGGSIIWMDDLYVCDNSGSFNNTFLGDISVIAQFPSGNGSLNNYSNVFASFLNNHGYVVGETFKDSNNNVQRCTIPGTSASSGTPTWATTGGVTTTSGGATFVVVGTGSNPGAANWMAVSEYPPDNDSSYVTDNTVGDQDRYSYPAISGSSVKAVVVDMRAEKDDSATRAIRAVAKSGGTTADNGADLALPLNTYAAYQAIFETDPNSGVAWTVSGVNAAEFGIKTTA